MNKRNILVFFAFLFLLFGQDQTATIVNGRLWISPVTPPSDCQPTRLSEFGIAYFTDCTSVNHGYKLYRNNGGLYVQVTADLEDTLLGWNAPPPNLGSSTRTAHFVAAPNGNLYFNTTPMSGSKTLAWRVRHGQTVAELLYRSSQILDLPWKNGTTIRGARLSNFDVWPGKDGRETVRFDFLDGNTRRIAVYERLPNGTHQLIADSNGQNATQTVIFRDGWLAYKRISQPSFGTQVTEIFIAPFADAFTERAIRLVEPTTQGAWMLFDENFNIVVSFSNHVAVLSGTSLTNVTNLSSIPPNGGGAAVDYAFGKVLINLGHRSNALLTSVIEWTPAAGKFETVAQGGVDTWGVERFNNPSVFLTRSGPGDVMFAFTNTAIRWTLWIKASRPNISTHPTQIPIDGKIVLTGTNFLLPGRPQLLVNDVPTVINRLTNSEIEFGSTFNLDMDVRLEIIRDDGTLRSNSVRILGNPNFRPEPVIQKVVTATTLEIRPLAPGGLGTIIGTDLCGVVLPAGQFFNPRVMALSTPWPTRLGNCQLRAAGVLAPLHYAATFSGGLSQMNFQAPRLPLGATSLEVVVERLTDEGQVEAVSKPFSFPLVPFSPSLFGTPEYPVILQVVNRGHSLMNADNPLVRSDITVAYGTGFGRTDPELEPGNAGKDQLPEGTFAKVVEPTRAWLKVWRNGDWDYVEIEVLYVIRSPEFPGVDQLAFKVPDDFWAEQADAFLVLKQGEDVFTSEMPVKVAVSASL